VGAGGGGRTSGVGRRYGPGVTTPADLPPHRAERAALCDLFVELGPDAPTLCEGWATADLAAHLAVREGWNPLPGLGIVVAPLHRLHDDAVARTKRSMRWPALVERVRTGPPLGPFRLLDPLVNTQEYFVHHEDARRGDGDHTPRPEAEVADVEAVLWKNLQRGGRFMARSVRGAGLELRRPDGETVVARPTPDGGPSAALVGRPGELVLYLFGRRTAADVELTGDAEAVALVEGASLGI